MSCGNLEHMVIASRKLPTSLYPSNSPLPKESK